MHGSDFDLSYEFCELANTPDLLTYLGIDGVAAPKAALTALRERRKFMQGMQANPKYKTEALFLIRHYSALQRVLEHPARYMEDVSRRASEARLPALEMTIKGVLAAGQITATQVSYLQRQAQDAGIPAPAFKELLRACAQELNVHVPGDASTPVPNRNRTVKHDLYDLLDVSPSASLDQIRRAHTTKRAEASALPDGSAKRDLQRRVDTALRVLTDRSGRQRYDQTARATTPPARAREFAPDETTAPPVRLRAETPTDAKQRSRLEILGEPHQVIPISGDLVETTIRVRNGGDGQMGGTVTTDTPWLQVHPSALTPDVEEQVITVWADPRVFTHGSTTARVTISTHRGERADVHLHFRQTSRAQIAVIVALSATLVLLILGRVFDAW